MYVFASANVHLTQSVEIEKHALIGIRPGLIFDVMRGAGLSVLLIVCLAAFLCPEVARPNVVTVTKAPDCCAKMSGCKMMPEQTSQHDRCGGDTSQRSSWCTISCSTRILFCPISDRFLTPRLNGHTFAIGDATASTRVEQPPIPPPRI
jgi:hypothetical protein